MIIPTVSEVVRNVGKVFEETIVPVLQNAQEKSTAQTMQHMFRYIEQRIEDEGQILLDEVHKLGDVLEEVAYHFEARSDVPATAANLVAAIRNTLAKDQDPAVYPSLTIMADRVSEMRDHVSNALTILNGPEKRSEDEQIHNALRDYIAWQIEQEGKIVQPAFWGHGPRR